MCVYNGVQTCLITNNKKRIFSFFHFFIFSSENFVCFDSLTIDSLFHDRSYLSNGKKQPETTTAPKTI